MLADYAIISNMFWGVYENEILVETKGVPKKELKLFESDYGITIFLLHLKMQTWKGSCNEDENQL